MKLKELWEKKNVRYATIGLGVAVVGIAGFVIYESNKVKVEFKLNENVIEYGTELKDIDWLKMSTTNGNKVTVKELDTKTVGKVNTKFNVCLNDTCNDFESEVEIKDTKLPEIVFKEEKLEITEGDEFDPVSNIESIKDLIDGDIEKSEDTKVTKNAYVIASEVDTSVPSDYKVKITAYDVNGNKAEKEYSVTVKEKPEEPIQEPTYQQSSSGGNANTYNPSGETSNTVGSKQEPTNTQPSATVCPNGNEPRDPSLPCDYVVAPSNFYETAIPATLFANNSLAYDYGNACLFADATICPNYSDYDIYYSFAVGPGMLNDGTEGYYLNWYK